MNIRSNSAIPLVVPSGEGESLVGLTGDTLTIKVDGNASGGRYCVFEVSTPPGGGTPLHCKSREDELFYVLAGEYEFELGQDIFRGGPGTLVLAPGNTPHRFTNVGPVTGRMLSFFSPAGIEEMSRESVRIPGYPNPQPDAVNALLRKYGITRSATESP